MRIKIGKLIRKFGKWVQPDYWQCVECGYIEYEEREVRCWKCLTGKMVYKL